jgi:hypothetical protein
MENEMGLKTIRECLYRTELDSLTLVATRGRDLPISMLQERLRCCHDPDFFEIAFFHQRETESKRTQFLCVK